MNYNLKIKRLTYAVVILVLLNLGTLAWMWYHRPPHPLAAAHYLEQELSLDETQQKQYTRLRQQHHNTNQEIRKQILEERKQILSLVGKTDSAQLQQHFQAIAQLCVQQEQNTYAHFSEVFKICTPAQQEKFYQIAPNLPSKLNPPKK